jgi:hypothetical protein
MIEERLTTGLSITKTDVVLGTPIITNTDVKSYLGIDFAYHDTRLTSLINTCRETLEQFKSITLIQERDLVVSWHTFYDYCVLPYLPLLDNTILAINNEGETIEIKIVGVGTGVMLVGDYEDGVKLNYTTGITTELTNNTILKDGLIRCVASVFEKELTPIMAIKKEFGHIDL